MAGQTRSGGSLPVGRLLALGLTFAAGYVLGARSRGESETPEPKREPTEIAIDSVDQQAEGEGNGSQ